MDEPTYAELRSKYDELKLHLEMYKDQWKRHWESRKKELEEETALAQANWYAEHLNHEVDDVKAELDEAVAACAHMRKTLERIVERCSWTREQHDPLVAVGLMANDALALDVGEGWISPKTHARALEQLRVKLERAAVTSLANIDDQLRVASSMRALPLEGQ